VAPKTLNSFMYIHVGGGRKFFMEWMNTFINSSEYITFNLLYFVFLSVQIWFLWKRH